jgi:hypothetical protein
VVLARLRRLGVLLMGMSLIAITMPSAYGQNIGLARLEPRDRVEATLSMWGCLGYRAKYQLVFTVDPSRTGRALVEITNVKGLRHKEVETRSLSPEELRSLDLGLDEYRRYRRGGCISTNLNRVRLKLIRNGELVTEEMYHGNSCNVHEVEGALDLEDLLSDKAPPYFE